MLCGPALEPSPWYDVGIFVNSLMTEAIFCLQVSADRGFLSVISATSWQVQTGISASEALADRRHEQ